LTLEVWGHSLEEDDHGGLIEEVKEDKYIRKFLRNSAYEYHKFNNINSGFAADGNSRLLLVVRSSKPGYVTFSFDEDIGAKIENLADRKQLGADDKIRTIFGEQFIRPKF